MKQLNTFAADDLALCRYHRKAVHEQFIDPTTPEDLRRHTEYTNHWIAVSRFERGVHMPTDLPLPPTYWDDPEHWTKTLAPAKPATPQPEPAAEVWHDERPPVFGVYVACHSTQKKRPHHYAHWSAAGWTITCSTPGLAAGCALSREDDFIWLRLVEADKPAANPVEQATYSVCIKRHDSIHGAPLHVGLLTQFNASRLSRPDCWLPCDKDGFVAHDPQPDSVCPVPAGVAYGLRLRNGMICDQRDVEKNGWELGTPGDRAPHMYDITAWRPTGAAA